MSRKNWADIYHLGFGYPPYYTPGAIMSLVPAIADMDDFDVADADADNERWNVGYITGTEGGSADINTTTANRLMVKLDPDGTPTEARYAVNHAIPFYADIFSIICDLSLTWGSVDSATAKAAGMLLSKGTTYDSTNYIAIERQKGTSINRYQVRSKLNNAAEVTASVNTTDDAVAFKIERWGKSWNLYYSTVQYPLYNWVLITKVEDPSNYMTNQVTLFFESYSKGTSTSEIVQGDFGHFRYIVYGSGGEQFIAGVYNSAWVTSNADGNVFERQEYAQSGLEGSVNAINRAVGNLQILSATVDLHNSAGNYTIATGTTQNVTIESVIFSPRLNVADDTGGITSISVQTDHTTPQVIISSTEGAIANLTAYAQLSWTGKILLQTGNLVQLTIAGGTADTNPTTCDVIIHYRANVNGGYLV